MVKKCWQPLVRLIKKLELEFNIPTQASGLLLMFNEVRPILANAVNRVFGNG